MLKTITPFAAALLVCSVALSAPARAEQKRAVHYGDLNLASPAGQKALSNRLRGAVRALCGTANIADLRDVRNVRRCRRAASEQAESAAKQAITLYRGQPEQLATAR